MSLRDAVADWCFQIGDLVSRDDNEPTYDLSEGDYKKLERLTEHAGWEVFTEVVDTAVRIQGEKLIHESQPDLVEFRRGTAYGMRKIALLVHNLIQQKEGKDARRKQQRESQQRQRARTRSTDLFGTSGFQRTTGRSNGGR